MNCLCNFFRDNECLIWIIIALIVLASLSDGCGAAAASRTGGADAGAAQLKRSPKLNDPDK